MKPFNVTKKSHKVHQPVRTLGEMAKEFGLTINQLRGHLSSSSIDTPKPVFETHSNNNSQGSNRVVRLYSHKEFRLWWQEHLKIINHVEE
jgi:hypothetical protein